MSRWAWIQSVFKLSSRTKIVGTDLQGNVYLEEIREGSRPRRTVKMSQGIKCDQYSPEAIPPAWTRWLQGLTSAPPTHEELLDREQQGVLLKEKVLQLERKEAQQQAQMLSDKAQTSGRVKAVEHASAPSFRSEGESREDPTSTGKTFQPATWQPGSKQES
ncbi:hypothetical protein EMCRGX_G019412 [Ephydatia muelleri]|eukprot:Em0011g581a